MNKTLDDLPEEPFKDVNNYIVKTAFIFCRHCNEILLTPEKGKEIIEKARSEWIDNGEWEKYSIHCRFASVACPKCHFVNYLAFMVQRYTSENNVAIFKRYRFFSIQFPDLNDMEKFKEWLNRQPPVRYAL